MGRGRVGSNTLIEKGKSDLKDGRLDLVPAKTHTDNNTYLYGNYYQAFHYPLRHGSHAGAWKDQSTWWHEAKPSESDKGAFTSDQIKPGSGRL
jgi:hypothetical protein